MRRISFTCLTCLLLAGAGVAEDWPRWRGPRGDGTWLGPKLPDPWPKGSLHTHWRVPIGAGYSGISVAGRRVFTMDRPQATQKDKNPDGEERVLCFDAATGKMLWSYVYPAHYGDLDYGSGPRANATVDESRVYVLGAVGHVHCLNVATGRVLWRHDPVAEMKARRPTWGFAASPVVIEEADLVVFHIAAEPNGSLVAFNRTTGKEVWRSLPDSAGYATPLLARTPSGYQLIAWTPENVHGLDPKTGKRNWSIPYQVTYGVSIATPIVQAGLVFVSGYWEGSKAIQLGPEPSQATIAWQDNRVLRGLMAPPLYRNGYAYLLDKQFGLTCFEFRTGKKIWDDGNRLTPRGRNPQASFAWIGDEDKVLALNSDGELILARLRPAGYLELGRSKIIGETWANPAFAGDSIYARSDREIIRVSLTQTGPSQGPAPTLKGSMEIDQVLRRMEDQTKGRRDVTIEFDWLDRDPATNQTKKYTGVLKAWRPGGMRIDWNDSTGNPFGIVYYASGTLRFYERQNRTVITIQSTDAPANDLWGKVGQAMASLPRVYEPLYLGATAAQIRERFDVEFERETSETIWLSFRPKTGRIKQASLPSAGTISLGVERSSGHITEAEIGTGESRSHVVFRSIRANAEPPLRAEAVAADLPKDFSAPSQQP